MTTDGTKYAETADQGWLRLTGRDRLDFLQRLSTNDFRRVAPPHGLPTVFASAAGRMVAFVIVYAGDSSVLVRTMPGQAADLARYLNRLIFWQDEVQVNDLTVETVHFALFGAGWADLLSELGAGPVTTMQPYDAVETTLGGSNVVLARGGPLELQDWSLAADRQDAGAMRDLVARAGTALTPSEIELRRIEKGLPLWGRELSGEVTPLEAGLKSAISFSKGCYTGQEVIARQTNYDKVTRQLVGLTLAPAAAADVAGATISGPGRGGFVTSSAYSPSLDRVLALAIVPRHLAAPGTRVEISLDETAISATVSALPFV